MPQILCWNTTKANPRRKPQRQKRQSDEREPIYKGLDLIQVRAGCFVNGSVAMGCMIKNQMNEVMLSANHGESIQADPATAEALAIRWCFQLGVDLKLHKGLVQSDSLTVVDCWNDVSTSTMLDPLILNYKHLLSSFKHFVIMFISRNLNVDVRYMVGVSDVVGSNQWMKAWRKWYEKLTSLLIHQITNS